MSGDMCFLITVLYGDELLRCALKVKQGVLPSECLSYPMEYREKLHALLPLHVRSCGPIVEIQDLFEVHEQTI